MIPNVLRIVRAFFSGVLVTQLPSLSSLVLTVPAKNSINVGIAFWRFQALYKYSAFLRMTWENNKAVVVVPLYNLIFTIVKT